MKPGLTLIFISLAHLLVAQVVEGFIVTHQGDTIQGQIRVTPEYQYYSKCIFIKDGGTTVFEPNDQEGLGISGYGFSGRVFERSPERKYFAELITRGSISLHKVNQLLYLSNGIDSTTISTEKVFEVDEYGDKVFRKNTVWSYKLKALTEDCLANYNYDKVAFSGKGIRKVIEDYNRCRNSSSTDSSKARSWPRSDFWWHGGVSYASMIIDEFTSSQLPFLPDLKFEEDNFGFDVHGGVSCYRRLPSFSYVDHLIVGLEFHYSRFHATHAQNNEPTLNQYDLTISRVYATAPLGASFKIGSLSGSELFFDGFYLANLLVLSSDEILNSRTRTDIDLTSEVTYTDLLRQERYFGGFRAALTYSPSSVSKNLF